MAGRQYLSDPRNPFFSTDDDDVDDATFLQHPKTGSSGYMFPNYIKQEEDDLEDKRLQLLERKRQIEERTIQSSQRSIGLLRDSEQIGVATAEELLRQREQLEQTEKRLDDINNTLRVSQKHIQSIKSVFGSLKNYFSGRSGEQPRMQEVPVRETSVVSPLSDTLDRSRGVVESRSPEVHPGLRVRGLDENIWDEPPDNRYGNVQKVLDENLDEMCGSLTRLKGLARGLGEEIESQNDLLDNITDKADRCDITVRKQNKEMTRILKK